MENFFWCKGTSQQYAIEGFKGNLQYDIEGFKGNLQYAIEGSREVVKT